MEQGAEKTIRQEESGLAETVTQGPQDLNIFGIETPIGTDGSILGQFRYQYGKPVPKVQTWGTFIPRSTDSQ